MNKSVILIADDDAQILKLISRSLQMEGFQTIATTNGQDAIEKTIAKKPHLLLLDVMMPKLDGMSVCQRVREFSQVPIIMVTAQEHISNKVQALNAGADDYLTKPFSIDELVARVRAVLRRTEYAGLEQSISVSNLICVRDVMVDLAQHRVMRATQEIDLTPLEYRLALYLLRFAGHVLTQDALLEQVWGTEYVGEYHLLQVNINRLRHKLERDPSHPRYILTKPNVGYYFALV